VGARNERPPELYAGQNKNDIGSTKVRKFPVKTLISVWKSVNNVQNLAQSRASAATNDVLAISDSVQFRAKAKAMYKRDNGKTERSEKVLS
jgi:hypothetical protein